MKEYLMQISYSCFVEAENKEEAIKEFWQSFNSWEEGIESTDIKILSEIDINGD